jgi:probable rRNA maturation factor
VIELTVDRDARRLVAAGDLGELRRRVARMVKAAWKRERTERELAVSVRLTADAAIRELNRDWRGKDRATDVLAFAQREGPGGEVTPEVLGDLVISVETALRQAAERDRSVLGELMHLAAHGLCHLLGYDHQTDDQEAEMNARADQLLHEASRRGPVRAA